LVTFDVPHIFDLYGGPRGLMNSLDRHQPRHGLGYNTVQMWLYRRRIPAKWIGAVLYAVTRDGHEVREFLVDDDDIELLSAAPRRLRA